jgi:NCS2 family nucleobase:cation symporter-2
MQESECASVIKPVCGIDENPPPLQSILFAFQHLFAMFSATILVPILVSNLLSLSTEEKTYLIQCALLASGVATIIQVLRFWRIGSRLPIVMGTSNAFLPIVTGIASRYGIGAVLAASFIGAIFETIIGFFLPKMRKLFSNLVLGIVVLTIGLTLIPVGIRQFGGGNHNFGSIENLFIAGFVTVVIIVCNQIFKGVIRSSAILIGMISGYILAVVFGLVSFAPVVDANWFSVPLPFSYTWTFHWDAIVAMLIMYVVTAAETMADSSAITMAGEGRSATHEELEGAVMADGVGSIIGNFLNAFPNTSYSQNVGVIALTGIMSRGVILICAFILMFISLLPKLSTLLAIMPTAVLGGASLIMFSMVASSGLVVLHQVALNRRNLLIIAVSLGLSVGLNAVPSTLGILPDGLRLIFAETGVATATVVSIILDQLLPEED